MAKDRSNSSEYTGPLRRLVLAVLVLVLFAVFLVWRIDSPRVERFRAQITARITDSNIHVNIRMSGAADRHGQQLLALFT